MKKPSLLYILYTFITAVVSSPLVALYGSDVILSCTFPHGHSSDTREPIIIWQKKKSSGLDDVVHSYYYQQDQLDLQDEAYRNQTQMFPEEFHKGNASLKLMRVRLTDEGTYLCYVENKEVSGQYCRDVVVAAPYTEPNLTFDLSNQDGYILLVLTSSGGYPSAAIQWLNETGSDITEKSNII
ncbi:CD276 antigen-like [Latimeria chalumnae]|uniref:CD276 antigen-like n=1 Tax=Latimeria chalumnae TaxID=7897 RepID=UPI0003C1B2F6|nr:PREDICTED: CD276 antigen-like [Latimeria chalumnae]|eukprot:XP_014339724.1 PREDICTED: CD276 antigen-like [Latimeria chalumnae]